MTSPAPSRAGFPLRMQEWLSGHVSDLTARLCPDRRLCRAGHAADAAKVVARHVIPPALLTAANLALSHKDAVHSVSPARHTTGASFLRCSTLPGSQRPYLHPDQQSAQSGARNTAFLWHWFCFPPGFPFPDPAENMNGCREARFPACPSARAGGGPAQGCV